jgi:hypothetical protein
VARAASLARVRQALEQLDAAGAADYDGVLAARAAREAALGRSLPGPKPSPTGRAGRPKHANVTDPDSRMLRSGQKFVQGYSAQAAVTGGQVIVAAQVSNAANDTTQLAPVLAEAQANLAAAGHEEPIGTVVADAGYWSTDNATLDTPVQVLIATTPATKGDIAAGDPRLTIRRTGPGGPGPGPVDHQAGRRAAGPVRGLDPPPAGPLPPPRLRPRDRACPDGRRPGRS